MTEIEFAQIIVDNGIFPTMKRLRFKLDNLFDKLKLSGKTVLDIGGGEGLLSFYSAYKGAQNVICLEPESEGSSFGVIEKFYSLKEQFQFSNVSLNKDVFQNFKTALQFDLILMYNSINHLNEPACINIRSDKHAKSEYMEYFNKLYALTNNNGILIISDCSNKNFWDSIRIRNPFAKNIEWNKHQSPEIWFDLAQKSGFKFEKLIWSSFNRLGKPGKIIFANKIAAYFFDSHFNLYLKKI
jgi:cyclopropane fatty-acyl-phospholipid synthase-like methyltransferase